MLKSFFLILLLFYQKSPLTFDANNHICFSYNDSFIIITKDRIHSSVSGKEWSSANHDINFDDFQKKTVTINNEVYIISDGLGKVYKLSKDENLEYKLTRFDNTENWRSNFNSFLFSFNDEIYSFGGYGFYSYKKETLKFNNVSKEWDLFDDNYFNSPLERSKLIGQLDFSKSNTPKLLIAMGLNYYYKDELLNDVWEYNLVNNKWTFKGHFNDKDFHQMDEKLSNNSLNPIQYKYKKNSIFHQANILFTNNKLIGYDLENNLKITYPEINYSFLNNVHNIVYNETTDFFMLIENPVFGIGKPVFVKREELLGKPIFSPLYNYPTNRFKIIYLIILLIIVFIVVFIIYLKNQKFSPNKLDKYNSKIKEKLSNEEIRIFDLLVKKYPQNLSFPDILNFYEQNLSYESRIKKLRLSLSNIDFIIKTSSKNKIELKYSRNKNDKRIKQCKLNFK